jgi:hypothetical protein
MEYAHRSYGDNVAARSRRPKEVRAVLYVDIPTPADVAALAAARGEACVSIYLRTTPLTQQAKADRIELKNLARHALDQLQQAGADTQRRAAIAEQLDDLIDDNEFWRFQAHSLAIFTTAENMRTFRVPNALEPLVVVSDRFHVKPLLRTVSFAQSCYVLALAQIRAGDRSIARSAVDGGPCRGHARRCRPSDPRRRRDRLLAERPHPSR